MATKAAPKKKPAAIAPRAVTLPGRQTPPHRVKDIRAQLQIVLDRYDSGEFSGVALVAVKSDGSMRQLIHADTRRGKMTAVLMLQSIVTLANSVGKLYPKV